MTDKAELLALALRCEQATGPDRELDAAIAIQLFDGGADHLDDARDVTRARPVLISHGARPGSYEVVGFSGVSLRTSPEYTASLDAAIWLLPLGMVLRRYVTTRYVPHGCEVGIDWAHGGWEGSSDHSFPLALTAACLRALASEQPA